MKPSILFEIALCLFLLPAQVLGAETESNKDQPESNPKPPAVLTPISDILALNARMRSMIDLFVKPIDYKDRRAQELYRLMFDADKFALQYDNSYTKTAIETVETGSGNCVSLANAFVAMARYAGLNARFLNVRVPDNWQRESDVYYKLTHISASVKVSVTDYLAIEYQWMGTLNRAKKEIISDEQAFGSFYSNRGIELLMNDNFDAAIEHLQYAVKLDPDSAHNWSNLGTAYRRMNKLDEAEQAYKRALKEDRDDPTALNNLAFLYQLRGETKLAAKYNKRLERYHLKNPYYLIKLAKDEMQKGDFDKALRYTRKAIRKRDDEHEFYFVAAKIYAHMGKTEKAMENLELAEKYAMNARNRNLYARKLELLKGIEHRKK